MSKSDSKRGISRRGFLKGAGVTAAGAAIGESAVVAFAEESAPKGPKIIGPKPLSISLKVNGAEKSATIEPRTTLAEALRVDLDMTGTKIVCDRGACSACTVWLDGTPVNSCMTLAIDAQGKDIRTIEGLAMGDTLHPVQEQFIEHD